MQKIIINDETFELPKEAAEPLADYLDRLTNFVEKNEIDEELRRDVESRIAEKIVALKKKKIDKQAVIDLVDSLGEPEEIFGEEEDFGEKNWEQKIEGGFKKVSGFFGRFFSQLKNLFIRFFSALRRWIVWISKNLSVIAKILIRFFFFGILFFVLAWFFVALIFVAALLFSDPIVDNQIIFAALPTAAKWGALAGCVGFLVLTIAALGRAFGKNWMSKSLNIASIFAIAAAIFVGIFSVFSAANFYVASDTADFEFEFPVAAGETVELADFSQLTKIPTFAMFDFKTGWDELDLLPSDDQKIHIKILARTFGQNNPIEFLAPVVVEKEGQKISAKIDGDSHFWNEVPLAFLNFEMEIFVPKNVKILPTSENLWDFYREVFYENEVCYGAPIFWDESHARFVCR